MVPVDPRGVAAESGRVAPGLADVVAACPDDIYVVLADGRVDRVVHVAGEHRRLDVVDVRRFPSVRVAQELTAAVSSTLATGACEPVTWSTADAGLPRGGPVRYYEARCSRLDATSVVCVVRDASRDQAERRRLGETSMLDPLTGLANRRALVVGAAKAVRRAWRNRSPVAIAAFDVDGFKAFNHVHGSGAGDDLLVAIAREITEASGEDIIARVGSDEFVLVVHDFDEIGDVMTIGARVAGAIERAAAKVAGGSVTASVGIAVAIDGDCDVASLLANAEGALAHARRLGRGRVQMFDPALQQALERRVELQRALRGAIDGGELQVHYQPIHRLATGRVVRMEAFLRWHRQGRGLVSAGEFLPLAHEAGLLGEMGMWAIQTACVEALRWFAGTPTIGLAVNVASEQIADDSFADRLVDVLGRTGFDPSNLTIEITEAALLDRVDAAPVQMNRLRQLGVRFALDDFGTGYSSLTHLQRFPFTSVKIDRSFLNGVEDCPTHERTVEAMVLLAHSLGLAVTAEGVENASQLQLLRRLACDEAQGYLLGAPQSASTIVLDDPAADGHGAGAAGAQPASPAG